MTERSRRPAVPASDIRVTVGIPTYNRADRLRRAAESVLSQTHHRLQLLISDNASTDDTQAICEQLAACDSRVHYVRSPANAGPTSNFNRVFAAADGDYAMVLSDDDWLEPTYIERCLAFLRSRPDFALACGVAHYVSDGELAHSAAPIQLDQPEMHARILEYLRNVDENGLFYGLMPLDVLRRAAPLRNSLGNDWLFVASLLAQGKAATIADTGIMRDLGGTSSDIAGIVRTLRLPAWQARIPHLVIAGQLIADISWRAPVYATQPRTKRYILAMQSALAVINWPSLIWHLIDPAMSKLERRPRSGRIHSGYRAASDYLRELGRRPDPS